VFWSFGFDSQTRGTRARFCFCKNNKRTIIKTGRHPVLKYRVPHGSQREHTRPWRGTVCGRGLLAWTRWRPTATGVRSLSYPYHVTHTLILLTRASAQYSLPRPPVTAISRMRAGPMVCATFWRSKLSTPRSLLHWFCIVAILRSHSFTQSGPWIITTQSASNTLPRRDLGF